MNDIPIEDMCSLALEELEMLQRQLSRAQAELRAHVQREATATREARSTLAAFKRGLHRRSGLQTRLATAEGDNWGRVRNSSEDVSE